MDPRSMLGAAATIATLGASLTSCGSSGGLPRADLVSKANAICAATQKSASAVPSPTSLQDAAAAAAYFDKIAPITDKETSDLAALQPNGAVARDWAAFLTAQRSANKLLQTLRSKADAKDASGVKDLAQVTPAGDRVLGAATKLGANTCAK